MRKAVLSTKGQHESSNDVSDINMFKIAMYIFGIIGVLVCVVQLYIRSEHRLLLTLKFLVSAFLTWTTWAIASEGGGYALLAILPFCIVGFMWTPTLVDLIGGSAGRLYSGDDAKLEKKALLARAESLRMRGKYAEALEEAQEQLEGVGTDFECSMLIATIHAEDLKDMGAAAAFVESILAGKKLKRQKVAYALNTLADWQLKYGRDPDAASATLARIVTRYPESKAAQMAENRIAHMIDKKSMEAADRPKEGKVMPKFERDLGLKGKLKPVIVKRDPDVLTAQYRAKLEAHPNDWDTREKLATHYVEEYDGIAAGVKELEILIRSKTAGKRDKIRWLQLIASWQIKIEADPMAGRATFERIITMFPDSAYAQEAERAISYIQGAKLDPREQQR